ncbi:SRPBCC family protein [Deinococcus multiflagellatus]|uniref:SRPBCC domain-containing protein n=1 Tax=Deinococcus multiflagellatus TaxID=1656887 RepID=A0ABW1ZMB5_9DEIO|nr:SRPBCC domain-containing protein [Deinococcus multiflagellatus]MBZ9714842.1 SRPBCC domain-containing protein [Deinococcus multiflagellatus]
MSQHVIVKDYPYPRPLVWAALTDPQLVPLWTSAGQGGRPEGFVPKAGTRFRFVGKPFPGWDGIVLCEVLDAQAPSLLRYTWRNKVGDSPSLVTNRLEEVPGGTRLTWSHTGFRGAEGFIMARLLGSVRRKMLSRGLPAVLNDLDAGEHLQPGGALHPGA